MDIPDTTGLLELTLATARRAGELLLDRQPGDDLDVSTKSSPTDIVTAMDRASERLIVAALLAERPDDGILGEEEPGRPSATRVRWVIDPLDGTVNYLYGLPNYAVSIAAEVDGTVVAGVVHAPALGETYRATRGGGAWCDGRRLRCTDASSLPQALIATGFGYAASRRAAQARVVGTVLPAVRDIRRMGAAALDLCAVAAGRVDGFYERGLASWDLAAGRLIATEAGAVVQGLHGRPADGDLVIAAGPRLFGSLHDLLAPLGADRD